VHGNLVTDDALVPAAEYCPGRLLRDSLLAAGPGEVTNCGQIREPGDGGEGDVLALISPQELSAAEPADGPQMPPDFGLVMATLTLYWATRTAASSLLPYWAHRHAPGSALPPDDPPPTPTAIDIFGGEIVPFPSHPGNWPSGT
jgi:hypothetical protein